ncbi:N-acetylglucosaminyldiphosphoundecaprenol N-acetyl-beta-D-mannosaminyltransferase [Arenibacter palladensis]|uniref:N-acetylglucosaminyldiphosphoundecaprenol N-acetyl-beta-D-mannosaminyltransferase n=1 Tax=Arenibacter palladensis TaxID=237373 RepID=A0A1M5G4F4_9FLAO|nr:WecB/TagA/CpsF family glycosyltransferase [Arenibacter palladensis]SHF98589.1 N-acetylglucosaminyldiphosphoundecaprenol N-acetyl-beta-D-mannosaminyltransferase [Arenibacter palladensis]
MKLLGHTITLDYPLLPVKKKTIINTINPHSYCISKQDKVFESALRESTVLLPDGIGIVWAAKVINGQKIHKIAGYDIFIYAMQYLESKKGSCFFLGASKKTLNAITQKLAQEFPNVKVNTFSPPFKPVFSTKESNIMCQKANSFRPEIIFVGMTAPKQEKWVYQYKDDLNAEIICSIGAVFDFYAGTVKRPNKFWIKLGLEWLPRFFKEPRRLARRNLISTPKFILEVICFKILGRGILKK